MSRLPPVKNENRILIVCEGDEEYDYLQQLKSCNVWRGGISVDLKKAGAIDNISAVYSYYYSNGRYKLVVAFCDTEKYPYSQFLALKRKINELHGKRNAADKVVYFANPCTMQIILSHFAKVKLTSNDKSVNSALIKSLTGVGDYRATEQQRQSIVRKITAENYSLMEQNISSLSNTYTDIPSSNILQLFYALDNGDKTWIKEINKKIGG